MSSAAKELSASEEGELLGEVQGALATGLRARQWWLWSETQAGYTDWFPITRSYNPGERSYGFFGSIPDFPVMGMVQQMPFDTTKAGSPGVARDEMREFVLHYFMRLSDFSRPATYALQSAGTPSGWSRFFSWCSDPSFHPRGFGFEQLYYQLAGARGIGCFPESSRFEIADLRQVGPVYDWILLRVRIYDFVIHFRPFGYDYPGIEVPLPESNYLLVTPHFIVDDARSSRTGASVFGFGYALLRNPGPPGLLAYGPGHFRGGFQTFEFIVDEDGRSSVRMVFVVDRPAQIVRVLSDPFEWSAAIVDLAARGSLKGLRSQLASRTARLPDFDPVLGFIDAAAELTGGQSSRALCINRRQLETDFLVQHFMQHYEMVTGSLSTWSQVPDWLNPATVPEWVKRGIVF